MRLLPFALLLAIIPASAQTVPPEYQVGRWQGFRQAAVSFTFDDGTPGHLGTIVPLFDEFGFRATLFTVTSWSPDWTGLAAAAADGHEVASHTVTHPYLNQIGGTAQLTELRESHDAIAANIPGSGSQTLAYPFCVEGNETATLLYYFAARGCQGAVESATPADFLNISSIIAGPEGSVRTAADLNARVGAAASSGGWAVFLMHGVDSDGGWSPFPSSELRTHLEMVQANASTYWIETFGNVVRYIRERDGARITELSNDGDAIALRLSDGLPDATYDYPLTVRRELPAGWTDATVRQNGVPVPDQGIQAGTPYTVTFDAVPDAGDITIGRTGATGSERFDGPGHSSVLGAWPNPAEDRMTLDFQVARAGHVTLEVYDLLGRRVDTLVSQFRTAGRYTHYWLTGAVGRGQYVYRLSAESDVDSGVVVLY